MCDYSLMIFPNRLANEGETLITHRFSTGAIGFVSPIDLSAAIQSTRQRASATIWSKVKTWFAGAPEPCAIPAICVPPGARLKVDHKSERDIVWIPSHLRFQVLADSIVIATVSVSVG